MVLTFAACGDTINFVVEEHKTTKIQRIFRSGESKNNFEKKLKKLLTNDSKYGNINKLSRETETKQSLKRKPKALSTLTNKQ